MGSPSLRAPPPNTVIVGKYKVGAVIAAGGMGVVVEGEHTGLGQRVAIKFLLPEAAAQPEIVERFLREARAAAKLQSDHVVRVFDMGTDEQGRPFMVMERLTGSDLDAEMEARGALPTGEAVGYVVQALDAIIEAHAAGIVHRDLKPSNLFLVKKSDGSRRVKVLDFGISKFAPDGGAVDVALTSTQSMLGSPGYMSPEQVRSTRNVDARTDVWALGVILHEMLSGATAFSGESLGDVFAKIREDDLPDIRVKRPDVPDGLAALLAHCVQRDRNNRVADATTLRDALLPYSGVGGLGDGANTTGQRDARTFGTRATEARTGGTLSAWTDRTGTHRKSRLVWLGSGAAAVLAVAVGLWSLRRSPQAVAEPHATASGSAAPSRVVTPPAPEAPAITPALAAPTSVASVPSIAPPPAATAAPVAATAHRPVAARTPQRPTKPAPAAPPPPSRKKDTLGL